MSLINNYKAASLFHMHRLLEMGFERALPYVDSNTHEEVVTEYIINGIQEVLDDPVSGANYRHFSVVPEYPLSNSVRHGKNRRKIDIRFEHSGSLPRMKYHVECKRLKRPDFTERKYIGRDGLQCFLTGEYAHDIPFGGMIGYIQSDNLSYWYTQIAEALCRSECNQIRPLSECSSLLGKFAVYRSIHVRSDGNKIILNHVFLPLRN